MPKRIQRKRTKGWRMPVGCVSVTRPGIFGNPFTPEGCRDAGYRGTDDEIRLRCVEAFRVWLGPDWRNNWDGEQSRVKRERLLAHIHEIRGKDLACFCSLDKPCHADVLLEIANR